MNVKLFDIETSPLVAATFSLYPDAIPHDNVVNDWYIICAAWKTLDKRVVDSVKTNIPGDDYKVCKALRDGLSDADILIGHNLDQFDVKKLNARLIYYGLDPMPQIPTVDTLKEIRKIAKFSSNRLDYLAKHLCGAGKLTTAPGLWLKAFRGDKKAIAEMVDYCKQDVLILEKVYKKVLPYIKTHPHVGVMKGQDRHESCPKCGSLNIKKEGTRVSAAGVKKQAIQCLNCHSYSRIPFK